MCRISSVPFRLSVASALFVVAAATVIARAQTREPDPTLTAAPLLGATPLAGENYTVASEVRTPDNYHVFTISSPFGVFEADGVAQVEVRLQEIAALGRLDGLS